MWGLDFAQGLSTLPGIRRVCACVRVCDMASWKYGGGGATLHWHGGRVTSM